MDEERERALMLQDEEAFYAEDGTILELQQQLRSVLKQVSMRERQIGRLKAKIGATETAQQLELAHLAARLHARSERDFGVMLTQHRKARDLEQQYAIELDALKQRKQGKQLAKDQSWAGENRNNENEQNLASAYAKQEVDDAPPRAKMEAKTAKTSRPAPSSTSWRRSDRPPPGKRSFASIALLDTRLKREAPGETVSDDHDYAADIHADDDLI
ncbi:unnamed protein product [Amoebophrya sp. A25]|nr:unnamed protein product [Amoebophrya sp. A25]|eukprot:GSA25T00001878001.1